MVQHIVLWKLKEQTETGTKARNIAVIKERLEALVGVVPGLLSARVGANTNGGEYDACLVSVFQDAAALAAYDVHPAHLAVRAFVKQARISRTSVDFELEEQDR